MKTINFFILILFLKPFLLLNQSISNLDYFAKPKEIIINYDLENCPDKKSYFDLKLSFINKIGEIIYPNNIYGDLKKVNCGINKKIVWNVIQDKNELKGEFAANLEITKMYNEKLGGPENAFLSILVPGLGNYFVDNKNAFIKPSFVTSITYATLLTGILFKISSYNNYTDYHNSRVQNDMNYYYSKANNYNQLGNGFLITGFSIWVLDIVYVAIKGSINKNNNKQLAYLKNNNFKIAYNPFVKSYELNYSLHF